MLGHFLTVCNLGRRPKVCTACLPKSESLDPPKKETWPLRHYHTILHQIHDRQKPSWWVHEHCPIGCQEQFHSPWERKTSVRGLNIFLILHPLSGRDYLRTLFSSHSHQMLSHTRRLQGVCDGTNGCSDRCFHLPPGCLWLART